MEGVVVGVEVEGEDSAIVPYFRGFLSRLGWPDDPLVPPRKRQTYFS